MLRDDRRKISGRIAGAVLALLVAATAARAHQCVEVEVLRAPDSAPAGSLIVVEASVTNCGDPARGFILSWVLVGENGDRMQLNRAVAQIEPGRTITGVNRLLLPTRIRPGVYHIGLVGETPSDFTDSDLVRIEVTRPR